MSRILHVPQPPPRQPNMTLAPDRRIAVSTISSSPHMRVSPTGLSVILCTRPRSPAARSGRPRSAAPRDGLCVDAQERLVQLLRIVEDGGPDLVLRPSDRSTIRIHLVRGVPSECLQAIPGR